jgi:ATP-dependent exoDNAse (exonuclease V) alpha subunit
LWYTAVTRAKTSLTAYASPGERPLSRFLRAGFADDTQLPDLDSLFEE